MDVERRLTIEKVIPAGRPAAWQAVTDPDAVSHWFTHCRRSGQNRYELVFAENDGPYTKHLVVLHCEAPVPRPGFRARLEDPGYPDSIIAVRLTPRPVQPDSTLLVLVHEDPPADLVDGYRTGWRDYLTALAEWVEDSAGQPGAAP